MNVVGGLLLDLLVLPLRMPRIVGNLLGNLLVVPVQAAVRVVPLPMADKTRVLYDLIHRRTMRPTILSRKLTFNDNAPITLNAYEYGKDYYRVNGLPSSIYEYNVLYQWLQKNHTDDPMTRQEIVSIDKVRFRLPTFAESQVEARGQLRVWDRRRSIGGGRRTFRK